MITISFDNFQVLEKQLRAYLLAVSEDVSSKANLPAFLE